MHVKFNIILLLRLIRKFNFIKGLILFFKLKTNKGSAINIPGFAQPVYLRPNTSDIDTFVHVFVYDEYKIHWKSALNFIIDAGANIGMFAIYMTNKFPESQITCLEPDPENFEVLKKNTENYFNITCLKYGVWNKECYLTISDKYDWGKWAMIVEESETKGDVHCISFNDVLNNSEQPKIDLLKIDIETSEKEVFSENYSNWLKKTDNIVIELHDRLKPNCSKTFFNALNNCFESYNYSCLGENTIIMDCKTKIN